MKTYEETVTEDARLVILRALAEQTDGRLNETIIVAALDSFGHRRSREWTRTQLNKLAELGAVTLTDAGSISIASLTRAGQDHVERRSFIAGIKSPSPEE